MRINEARASASIGFCTDFRFSPLVNPCGEIKADRGSWPRVLTPDFSHFPGEIEASRRFIEADAPVDVGFAKRLSEAFMPVSSEEGDGCSQRYPHPGYAQV